MIKQTRKWDTYMNEHLKGINRSLVLGWQIFVVVLCSAYALEVVKGDRDLLYLLIFAALTAIPALVVYFRYRKQPDSYQLRYEIILGYLFMYIFVMVTGRTSMVFSYILPMLSLLVLYHQPKLIFSTGVVAIALNLMNITLRVTRGELGLHNCKEAEIQLVLLLLCFFGSYQAARLYDDIHGQNEKYVELLNTQNEDIQRMTIQTIMTIANTIDAKDEYTRGHSRRVAEYAAAIAGELGMSEEEVSDMRYIGLLHDIGKIGIPDAVLNKPGKLTPEEYQVMKSHTTIGSEILRDINMIQGLDTGARYHHERYDGKGYPDGLAGEDIPYIARIIAVADAYDAMSSNRIYRRHLDHRRVMEELQRGAGVQWDPVCVDALIRLLDEGRLPELRPETDMVRHATTILSRVISVAESSAADGRKSRDELTGAYGRDAGIDAIQSAIYQCGNGWVLLFNIDLFHRFNQIHGFAVGDAALKLLVDTIGGAYINCIIARFNSDEFLTYVPDPNENVDALAERFYRLLREKTASSGFAEDLSVSIGMTQVFTEKDRVTVLYENANKALYVAKQRGGGSYYRHQMESNDDPIDEAPGVDLRRLIGEASSQAADAAAPLFPDQGRLRELLADAAGENASFSKVILFTLRTAKNAKPGIDERDRVMELLHEKIVLSAQQTDVIVKYSSTQYALFLGEGGGTRAELDVNHILSDFFKSYSEGEFELHCDTADLTGFGVL